MTAKISLFAAIVFFSQLSYAQCVSGNCNNGNGSYKWTNGDMYTGQWSNGYRNGYGRYDWADGSYYIGDFVNNILEGTGKYVGADGSLLEGTFKNGELATASGGNSGCISGNCDNGSGTYKWATGDMYTGDWKNGMRTGYGRYDWASGAYYVGYFKDNLLHGQGSYYETDGSTMIGQFNNNNFEGTETPPADDSADDDWIDAFLAESDAADEAEHLAVSNATKKDFCSLVQLCIQEFPKNFSGMKGGEKKGLFDMGSSWYSNVMVSNSISATISQNFMTSYNTFYNTLYEGDDFATAKSKYDEFVKIVNDCKTNCCTMVYDVSDYKGDSYESYMTNWLTFLVNNGYDEATYQNMVMEVELMSNVIGPKWSIVYRIYNLDTLGDE